MSMSTRLALLLVLPVLAMSCAKKEAKYESAMREWASKTCSCCQLPGDEANKCIDALQKPEFPDHFLDNMIDNPNHEVARQFEDQTRACCTRTP